jgi:hypothetical protein
VQAVRQTTDAYDTVTKLLESMNYFLMRYKMLVTVSFISKPLAETFIVMLIDVLKVCGISRRYIRRGVFRISFYENADLGAFTRNLWSPDNELVAVLEHFQNLANEEIAAGVAQLHVMMTESNETLKRIDSNISVSGTI